MVIKKNSSFLDKTALDSLAEVRAFLTILYPQSAKNNNTDCIFIRKSKISWQSWLDSKTHEKVSDWKTSHSNIPGMPDIGKISRTASLAAEDSKLSWHVVINGYKQGTTKFDKAGEQLIRTGRIVQFESDDDRSLEEKLVDWIKLGMPKPTLQVWTGNKSIHNYWVLDRDYPIEFIHQLQVQLTRKGKDLGADGWNQLDSSWGSTATKTMRMPGFFHPKTGQKARIVEVVEEPSYYSYERLWNAIAFNYELRGNWNEKEQQFDKWVSIEEQQEASRKQAEKIAQAKKEREENRIHFSEISLVDSPVLQAGDRQVSLLDLISQPNRAIYEKSSESGMLNAEGCRLANDLIGCENWALERDAEIVATAEELFLNYSRRSKVSESEGIDRFNRLTGRHKRPANKKIEAVTLSQYLMRRNSPDPDLGTKTLLGWDLLRIVNQLVQISAIKDEVIKDNLLKKWIEEDLEKDTSSGWVGVGNLVQIKTDLLRGEINLITSAEKTSLDSGFFTTDFNYCRSDNFKKIASLFNWCIENTFASRELTKHLFLAGAGNKIFLYDNNYLKWGAGYYFAKEDQKLTPDLILNRRYLMDAENPIKIPADARIVGIKAEMGTGKTTYLADFIKKKNYRPLAIYSRVMLTETVAGKFEIPSYKDSGGDQAKHHRYLAEGSALCINSLKVKGYMKFDPADWGLPRGRDILILDEIESTLETLCSSATINKNRGEIQKNFIQLIKNILDPESKSILILSDANLKQSTIDLFQAWIETPAKAFIIQNDWKFPSGRTANFYKQPSDFLGQLILAAKNEDRLYITSDTREAKSANSIFATETIEKTLNILGENVLRIDQQTQHTIDDPSYGLNADTKIINSELKRKNAHLAASPSLNAGASFDESNGAEFTSMWGAFKGVINISGIQQQIERDRRNIVRNLFVTETGKPNGCSPLTSESSLKNDEILEELLNIKGLKNAIHEMKPDCSAEEAEIISEKMLINENIHLAVWRRRNNIESSFAARNLKLNLISLLTERGYFVNTIEGYDDTTKDKPKIKDIDYKELLNTSMESIESIINNEREKDFKQLGKSAIELFQSVAIQCREEKLEAIVQADSSVVNKEMLEKSDRTYAEHNAILKYHYENWAKGVEATVETYEVWEKGKKIVENGFLNHCQITGNENARLKAIKEDGMQSSSGKRSKRDAQSSLAKFKVLANNIKLSTFIDWATLCEMYESSDSEVILFNERLLDYQKEIKALFGVTLSRNTDKVISNIGSVLRSCGRKQENIKQASAKNGGKRIRYYTLCPQNTKYSQFWEAWSTKQVKNQILCDISQIQTTLDKNLQKEKESFTDRLMKVTTKLI
jgi:hypothetical protein